MCKCREKNKAKGSLAGALSLLMEMDMASEPIQFVPLNLNNKAVLGSKVYVPARFEKALRGVQVSHYRLRLLTLVSRDQSVPSFIRDWMRQDYRYKDWFDASPVPVAEPQALELLDEDGDEETIGGEVFVIPLTPPMPEESVVDAPAPPMEEEEDKATDPFFEAWGRDDIESANLSGDEGLFAYADYMGIDLGDAKLKAEVLATILEWYDDAHLD